MSTLSGKNGGRRSAGELHIVLDQSCTVGSVSLLKKVVSGVGVDIHGQRQYLHVQ